MRISFGPSGCGWSLALLCGLPTPTQRRHAGAAGIGPIYSHAPTAGHRTTLSVAGKNGVAPKGEAEEGKYAGENEGRKQSPDLGSTHSLDILDWPTGTMPPVVKGPERETGISPSQRGVTVPSAVLTVSPQTQMLSEGLECANEVTYPMSLKTATLGLTGSLIVLYLPCLRPNLASGDLLGRRPAHSA
ncbi:hypothetical protein BJ085DRAFT_31043 [Dimargaris cristalligena]|uniref:Uncharacterized protein n=1 Tax=Dimargaris cristalligena TaxID=215637 RepID=A0A4P9ZVS9_9FUNG|nr:hypothetical protein BJ085DRAFT_31043 [Dimargaris cristalligena]|eukprot:RKP36750.1 hypothetical protein BJ085DRAFT_31043 [Dimargaris cristalligena]